MIVPKLIIYNVLITMNVVQPCMTRPVPNLFPLCYIVEESFQASVGVIIVFGESLHKHHVVVDDFLASCINI